MLDCAPTCYQDLLSISIHQLRLTQAYANPRTCQVFADRPLSKPTQLCCSAFLALWGWWRRSLPRLGGHGFVQRPLLPKLSHWDQLTWRKLFGVVVSQTGRWSTKFPKGSGLCVQSTKGVSRYACLLLWTLRSWCLPTYCKAVVRWIPSNDRGAQWSVKIDESGVGGSVKKAYIIYMYIIVYQSKSSIP